MCEIKLGCEHSKFNIDQFFNDFLNNPDIFKNRDVLESAYIPDELPHRDDQIKSIAQIMASLLKKNSGKTVSNIFLYGKTGTGKTAVTRYVSKKLDIKCRNMGIVSPEWVYINCNHVKSSYRVMATICNKLNPDNPVPPTGLPRDVLLERVYSLLDEKLADSVCFIILDEIDALKDKNSKNNVLYILSRINETLKKSKVHLIGISNILTFKDDLDPRVISSLSEEEIVFPAYNAPELYDILKKRVKIAIHDNIVAEGALRLCAAIAAKENGDARRALSLLRKSAELIERRGLNHLTEEHIYLAMEQIDRDKTSEFIKALPIQQKILLLSIYLNHKFRNGAESSTGEIYNTYCELVKNTYGLNELTSRRVTDLVKELDLAGIVSSKLLSFGRKGGRTRMICLAVDENRVKKCYSDDPRYTDFINYIPSHIRRPNINIVSGQKYRSLI